VLAVSTAVNALAWGARGSFALFYVAMLEQFAWGRGATALGYSLSWLCFVVFAPVAGWLHDRWGARAIVALGGLLLAGALALTARVTSLVEYYLCFGVLGAAGTACILIPSTTIVSRSFVRARGTGRRPRVKRPSKRKDPPDAHDCPTEPPRRAVQGRDGHSRPHHRASRGRASAGEGVEWGVTVILRF
jgi:hypothetical protein